MTWAQAQALNDALFTEEEKRKAGTPHAQAIPEIRTEADIRAFLDRARAGEIEL